jgi:predicted regulator of Ras-like GTPase activity (Roadblock/LC7/MglB family)
MRQQELPDLMRALSGPVDEFVHAARVRMALLVNRAGQVLAQQGFTKSYEVMNVASLAAAAHASSQALAELVGTRRWKHLHHAGRERQLFLALLDTPFEPLIVVVVFDQESSLGIVELFFDRLAATVAALPQLRTVRGSEDATTFERDLEAGLERVLRSPDGEFR